MEDQVEKLLNALKLIKHQAQSAPTQASTIDIILLTANKAIHEYSMAVALEAVAEANPDQSNDN